MSEVDLQGQILKFARLTVEESFDAAHIVSWHPKCSQLHGHTYTVQVTVEGVMHPRKGMLVDFGELKGLAREHLAKYDHRFIVGKEFVTPYPSESRYSLVRWGDDDNNFRRLVIPTTELVILEGEATVENIGHKICHDLLHASDMQWTVKVTVFEGHRKSATVS